MIVINGERLGSVLHDRKVVEEESGPAPEQPVVESETKKTAAKKTAAKKTESSDG